jgi:hypothetical protein
MVAMCLVMIGMIRIIRVNSPLREAREELARTAAGLRVRGAGGRHQRDPAQRGEPVHRAAAGVRTRGEAVRLAEARGWL